MNAKRRGPNCSVGAPSKSLDRDNAQSTNGFVNTGDGQPSESQFENLAAFGLVEKLLDAGIPVVVCRPTSSAADSEFRYPTGWAGMTPDDCLPALAGFRPGSDALAMVSGHGIDVLDVDAKDGGDVSDIPEQVRTYGIHRSPSGGWHLPVPSTGFGKNTLRIGGKHVGDYLGGTSSGGGHALCFLPGSTRSKYPDGKYSVEEAWDIDGLLKGRGEEDVALIDVLERSGLSRDIRPGQPAISVAGLSDFLAEHSEASDCPYGRRALEEILAEAAQADPSDPVTGRHSWLVRSLVRVCELIVAGCLDSAAYNAIVERLDQVKPEGGSDPTQATSWAIAQVDERKWNGWCARQGHARPRPATGKGGETPPEKSMRDLVVDLAEDEFRIGISRDRKPFLVENDGPNMALFGTDAKHRLAARMRMSGNTPGRSPQDEAWGVITGISQEKEPEDLPIRVAGDTEMCVIDLGTADGSCVVASRHGWNIEGRSPVTFRRSKAQSPLPLPSRNGDRQKLWDVINVDPTYRDSLWAWLISALIEKIPHPIIQLRGEMGSAKSTATALLGKVIDPGAVDTIAPPKDAGQWQVTCNAKWFIGVDNVSGIAPWWSDELCRTVTGSGTLQRVLYTDNDVTARINRGCVILNGITLTSALRSDFGERLPPIDMKRPEAYRTESEIQATFDRQHSSIFGALLDDLVLVLKALPTVPVPSDLRMADYGQLLAAVDKGLGLNALVAYRNLQEESRSEALDGDPVARTILRLMSKKGEFEGSATELLRSLTAIRDGMLGTHELSESGYWPNDAANLSRSLSPSGPLIRAGGYAYSRKRDSSGNRIISISKIGKDTGK